MKTNKSFSLLITLFILHLILGSSIAFSAPKKENAAAKQEVINLDFKVLEELQKYVTDDKTDLKEIPENIQSLNGKTVRITGYFMVPADAFYSKEPISNFAVGKSAYGCPCCNWGDPPTIFNTIVVDMREGEKIKPPFSPLVEVTGVFLVKKEQFVDDEGQKRLDMIFYIKDALAKKKKQSLLQSIF